MGAILWVSLPSAGQRERFSVGQPLCGTEIDLAVASTLVAALHACQGLGVIGFVRVKNEGEQW